MERTGEYIDATSRMLDYRGMRELFSGPSVYQAWLDIEAAVATAQGELGIIPTADAAVIARTCRLELLDMARVESDFAVLRHPLVPLLNELVRKCGEPAGRYVHWGLATQNIQQTGTMYLALRGHNVLLDTLSDILQRLGDLAIAHADDGMAGRTHGQHAVPITFGFKVAIWIDELLQAYERLRAMEHRVFTVTMGGAVGAYSALGPVGPALQTRVAELLGMHEMALPSRTNRTHMCEYVQALALTASTFHQIAEDVSQSSGAEFGELFEGFGTGVVGSSTMPQKVNPKISMGIMANAHKLYALSSMILTTAHRPFEGDACANIVYDSGCAEAIEIALALFVRTELLVRGLHADTARMIKNLNGNDGLIYAEAIMMKLATRWGKHAAHDYVYDKAMQARRESRPFFELLATPDLEDFLFDKVDGALVPRLEAPYGIAPQQARAFGEKAHDLCRRHEAERAGANTQPATLASAG